MSKKEREKGRWKNQFGEKETLRISGIGNVWETSNWRCQNRQNQLADKHEHCKTTLLERPSKEESKELGPGRRSISLSYK